MIFKVMAKAKQAGSLAGALAFAFLIWFAGPMIGFGASRPLESVWARLLVIILVVGIILGWEGWRYYQRRRKARELEAGLAHSAEEASLLDSRMKDALATLRKAHGGPGYLYSLPWYILIGPPGSGKTTALINSGLKFPLQAGGGPASVEGVGGTRYCDWWFTEDAVLVDTAGRYTTQEADTPGDRRAWLDFLAILRRNRPRQPINGALVAVSLDDLLSSSPEELKAHAEAIRSRLLELHEQLKIDFPVYVIFTKTDLVAGFREYFSNLREVDRRAVWGATFQTADRTQNMIGEVPAEFDLLIRRLNERVPDRMQEETDHRARVLIFGFPAQMMALRERLVRFMNDVFEPTRYHANATLRGLYFTSGTQQGTPIDQFLSEVAPSHGELSPLAFSGKGKSFFLTDLINKVILGEAGWGAVNRGVATRARFARGFVYAAMVAVAAVCVTLWSISFFENRGLVAAVAKDVNDIRFNAATLLNQSSVGDFDFGLIQQQVLDPLRNVPAGYVRGSAPVPWKARMGLSQQERLHSSLEAAYQRVLERMLRPRMILRLEDRLEAIKDDPGAVYDALKVYLMLGGLHKSDDPQILAWLRQDWQQNLYPGSQYAKARERLEQHAAAMLDLDVGTKPLVQLSEPVVSDAQKVLMRMSLADRGYQLLKSDARAGSASDWVLTQRSGPYADDVFETADGSPLENVIIPGFLTYAGFHTQFLAKLADVESGLAADKWVLGPEADKAAFADQYATLRRDLQSRYDEEFVRAWTGMLNGMRLKPLTADKQLYSALSKASGPNSPIRLLLTSVRDETTLNVERAGVEPELPTPAVPGGGAAASAAKKPAADQPADTVADINSGREVSSRFAQLHALVEGAPGSTPIDAVLASLSGIYDNLMAAKDSPQAQQINADLLKQVATLRTKAMTQLPRPVSNWVLEAASDIDGDVADASIAQLSKVYNDDVGNVCQRVIANRYPFVSNAAQEVQLRDFAQVFQPGGLFDRFFKEHLEPLVDTSGPQWVWRQKGGLSASLSNESLRQFQRAAEIKQAFFSSGTEPSVSLVVTPAPLSPGTKLAKMKINAAIVESQPGVSMSSAVEWPGAAPDNHVAIVVQSGDTGQRIVQKEKRGPWALFRMLDESTLFRRGDALLATIDVQGQQISYEFSASSVNNPFLLPALHEFRCPSGF